MAVGVKAVNPSRARFAAAARYCKSKVAHLPKGQKGPAYRQCIREYLKTH
jgi:hypothetical protein